MLTHKKFISCFGAIAVILLIAIFAFNFTVDPHSRYRFSVKASDLIDLSTSKNKLLTVPANYDDRILLKHFIEASPNFDFVVIGGSRVMNLSLPEVDSFLNAGVTSATIRDYVAIWETMKEAKKIPKRIIIGLDPQAMNSAAQNKRWLSLAPAYERFHGRDVGIRDFLDSFLSEIKDLLSCATLIDSFRMLRQTRLSVGLVSVSNYDGNIAARNPAFSMIYPKDYESKSSEEIELMGKANGQGEAKDFHFWNREDRQSLNELHKLVGDMQNSGAKVLLVLMPCQPASLDVVKMDPVAFESLRHFRGQLAKLSSELNASYYDGFGDTEKNVFTSAHFLDGVHLKGDANTRYFRRVLKHLSF